MTTITLKPTDVYTIPISIVDPATNQPEPIPAGDKFSAASSSPAVSATIGTDSNGSPTLILNALTLPNEHTMGVVVEVSDSAGDVAVDLTVDYPVPAEPGEITLGTAAITEQPAPTTPGP